MTISYESARDLLKLLRRDVSTSLDMTWLFGAIEFAGEKIIHHQCRDESGDAKILLRIVIQHMQSKFITSAGKSREEFVHGKFLFVCPLANRI